MTDREMVERLMDYIDEQATVVESLREYIYALEQSILMRKVTMRLLLPPPG